jgi:hypothetical protein
MTKQEYITQQAIVCRHEWFKEHQAVFIARPPHGTSGNDVIIINWQNPKSWNYGCRFIIHRRWLIVVGDIGEATYEWSQDLTLEFLASLDFGYFHSKCVASEAGRKFEQWDGKVAYNNRQHRLAELKATPKEDASEGDKSEIESLEELGDSSKDEYERVARDYYDEIGDAEGAGAISIMGIVPNSRCIGHFVGLQMAIAQLNPPKEVK